MARMHTRRRGSSDSDKPVADDPPEWSDVDEDAVEQRVADLAGAVARLGEFDHALLDRVFVNVAPLRWVVCHGLV